VYLNRELERKAEMQLGEKRNEAPEKRKAALLEKRFHVVPIRNTMLHFVTIESSVLYGMMQEISPKFDVSPEEFTGIDWETHWKNVFDFKGIRKSSTEAFAGKIETDGVCICVHSRRLSRHRHILSSFSPWTKHQKREAIHMLYEPQKSDFVVGVDPGKKDIMAVAVP
jgi:hypothetical protein